MAESFLGYPWQYRYCTSALNRDGQPTDVLHDFYLPALQRALRYDRVAGYFRSSSLAAASQGYTAFLRQGESMRLIVGADLALADVAVILRGQQQRLSDRLMAELDRPETWPEAVRNGVALLGELVAAGKLTLRVAFRTDARSGEPLPVEARTDGYVHEKWFILSDGEQHRIYGSGSLNESRAALTLNAENVDIHCDWTGDEAWERTEGAAKDFERLWSNRSPHMRVLPLPEAVRARLVQLRDLCERPTEIDGTVLPMTPRLSPRERLQFAFLRLAPRTPGGEQIGLYSAPVSPWPHQEIVSRRLVESWPYSYLLCDEVGLGKTVEAALAIRSLVLSGRVKRVLIVAPASLTEQWHRELAEKAMLPFALSRVKPGSGGQFSHSFLYPDEAQRVDGALYGPDLNIVSSGLVRRRDRLAQLRAAEDFDIVLVDEAHYARRQNPREGASGAPKYGDLYEVLDKVLRKKTQALWMATATPMQIDPIEVYDLLRLTGRVGQFQSDPMLTMAYFEGLGTLVRGRQPSRQTWAMLGQSCLQIEKLDPFLWEFLQQSAITGRNRKALHRLPEQDPPNADLKSLSQPLFAASPLSRVMMRHTRALLELYRQNGQLHSNLARRHVRPVCAIPFTPAEAAFYEKLEAYCSGLEAQIRKYNPQTRQVMFFLLNFLQLRFASSFHAIQRTLERRLRRVKVTLQLGCAPDSEQELQELLDALRNESDDYSEGDLDDITMDALLRDRSVQDLEWEEAQLSAMLEQLNAIHETPSKLQALLGELDRRKLPDGRLRQTVLFTRFYDTLSSIRDALRMLAPSLRVGVYAGGGRAFRYDPDRGRDSSASHEEIKARFLAGEIDLLLCTDAAAEGLNLQTADLLINFDLGWNPMKIEQRIGRIDRIGQTHADIKVWNLCYLGSTEEIVYGRLLSRLQQANLIVGAQQISLLPVTQEEFRKLHAGTLTPEALERQSIQRLEQQRKANASMELSAEDLYAMYQRMRAQMLAQPRAATVEDLWSCLTQSEYLKRLGAKRLPDGNWRLPPSDRWPGMLAAMRPEAAARERPYLSWSHPTLSALLEALGGDSEDAPYLHSVTLPEEHLAGLAVATASGVKLVTSFAELEGLEPDVDRALSEEDLRSCALHLRTLGREAAQRQQRLRRAEQENEAVAALHAQFLLRLAVGVLRQLERAGCAKLADATKQLEANAKALYFVDLPAEQFAGRESDLLFGVSVSAAGVRVPVREMLLRCTTALVKRESAALHGKKAEKTTAELIHRLERKL